MNVSDTKTLLIGAIVLIALALSGITMLSVVNNYAPSVLGNSSQAFYSLNDSIHSIYNDVGNIQSEANITGITTSKGAFGFIDTLFSGAIKGLRTIYTGSSFLLTFFGHLGVYMGLPVQFSWVGNLIGYVISFILIFALLKAMLKTN